VTAARLSPGDTAPDFTLTSDTGEEVTLSDLRGRKVIVYFYPAAMTPGCTKQACDFTITLLSDPDKQVMQSYGAYGEKKLYGKVVEGVIRSTIVVDEEGKVEVAQYNVKATGHVAKLRKDLGLAT
jgi:peroxiredoxin Q/BCP